MAKIYASDFPYTYLLLPLTHRHKPPFYMYMRVCMYRLDPRVISRFVSFITRIEFIDAIILELIACIKLDECALAKLLFYFISFCFLFFFFLFIIFPIVFFLPSIPSLYNARWAANRLCLFLPVALRRAQSKASSCCLRPIEGHLFQPINGN